MSPNVLDVSGFQVSRLAICELKLAALEAVEDLVLPVARWLTRVFDRMSGSR